MFTGLIEGVGRVARVERTDRGVQLWVSSPLAAELSRGDSIAVNGVCLSAVALEQGEFAADVMNETLARTSLRDVKAEGVVNLELPLRAGERLGGHIVQGHVDGTGVVSDVTEDGFARRLKVDADDELLRYVVPKGSIAVDGVSLTVAEIDGESFTVSLIPDTLERTNLGATQLGATVNLEVDVVAKYVEKLIGARA